VPSHELERQDREIDRTDTFQKPHMGPRLVQLTTTHIDTFQKPHILYILGLFGQVSFVY